MGINDGRRGVLHLAVDVSCTVLKQIYACVRAWESEGGGRGGEFQLEEGLKEAKMREGGRNGEVSFSLRNLMIAMT